MAVAISITNTDAKARRAKIGSSRLGRNAIARTMNGTADSMCRGPVAVPPPQ